MNVWPSLYLALKNNLISYKDFTLLPVRYEDRYSIMKWRNDQLYHLRQKEILTKKNQDFYFKNIIKPLFEKKTPDQLIFSLLRQNKLVAYGGLVHINWQDSRAEISFVMDTELEKNKFKIFWTIFLEIIEKIAFEDLDLNKIYVYAFDLRPKLYDVLKKRQFTNEARLKDHVFVDSEFKDVVIYSKLKKNEKNSNFN